MRLKKGPSIRQRTECYAMVYRVVAAFVLFLKDPQRFFKPLRYVVPHFFRACQNRRPDITQFLAPESKGLDFRFADHPGVDTTFVNTSAFRGTDSHNPLDGCRDSAFSFGN